MRAVNLIPTDLRRGPLAGRGGEVVSYVVIASLVALLLAVLMVVVTNNKISDREADVVRLQQEEQDAKARADALQSFAGFRTMEEARTQTVSSLAQSRFDWERVINEFSRVLPNDVWLVKMSGKVLPDTEVEDEAGLPARSSIAGPALEIVGCAPGQDAVAGLVAALEDIDGVTRVGVQSSDKSDDATAAGTGNSGEGGATTDECRTRDFISKFEIVVAFDAAPVPAAATGTGAAPAPTTPSPTAPEGEAQQQQAAEQQEVQQAQDKSQKATELVPGK